VNLMNIRTLATAFAAAALFGLTAAPARAQTAAPGAVPPPADAQAASAKPKANTAGAPVTVTVTNSRKADLVQLQAAQPGTSNWKKVLGPVKSGKQASTKLPQAADCRFDLHGTFADGQSIDASGVKPSVRKARRRAAWPRSEARPRSVNLSEANLFGANLSSADVQDANLEGADLGVRPPGQAGLA
jgi:uncharacterized protein YjbI with pentapeptide repeats